MSERAEPAADELAAGIHKAAKQIGDDAEDIGDEAQKSVSELAKQVYYLYLLSEIFLSAAAQFDHLYLTTIFIELHPGIEVPIKFSWFLDHWIWHSSNSR